MGNKEQTAKGREDILEVLVTLKQGKQVKKDSIKTHDAIVESLSLELIEESDEGLAVTTKGMEYIALSDYKVQKQEEEKELHENIQLKILSMLQEDNGSAMEVEDMKTYDALDSLVERGYAIAEDIGGVQHYTKTKDGADYYDYKQFQESKDEEYDIKLRESYITVSYKRKHDQLDLIENVTDKFLLENDGIPVIRVEPSQYKALLDRNLNEHWHKYVGEGGGKLIKKKKLKRFYVENSENKRRYLYLVPQS